MRRLFPACAGVILIPTKNEAEGISFPRMRGGDPLATDAAPYNPSFSPHVRG